MRSFPFNKIQLSIFARECLYDSHWCWQIYRLSLAWWVFSLHSSRSTHKPFFKSAVSEMLVESRLTYWILGINSQRQLYQETKFYVIVINLIIFICTGNLDAVLEWINWVTVIQAVEICWFNGNGIGSDKYVSQLEN